MFSSTQTSSHGSLSWTKKKLETQKFLYILLLIWQSNHIFMCSPYICINDDCIRINNTTMTTKHKTEAIKNEKQPQKHKQKWLITIYVNKTSIFISLNCVVGVSNGNMERSLNADLSFFINFTICEIVSIVQSNRNQSQTVDKCVAAS